MVFIIYYCAQQEQERRHQQQLPSLRCDNEALLSASQLLHSDPSHFVTIFLHSFFSILTPYPTGGSTEFSQLFGIECTPNKRVEPLCSSVNTNCTGQGHTDRDNLVFGSDRTPNKSSEPLFACTDTNCPGQTDRQNVLTSPSASLFLKGLPPKQPEGFGSFVYPNSRLKIIKDL